MRLLLSLIGALAIQAGATAACPPEGMSRSQLAALRSAKWDVADNARRQLMAGAMLDCLADPDPLLRDDTGFEALQMWMRTQKLEPATMQKLRATLQARMQAPEPSGFAAPFAALALAEVVRADRLKPFLSDGERADIVRAATAYLGAVRDYRGFDEKDGWRHGVAHAADLMLQLALHPALGKPEHQAMLAAIASQLSTPGMQNTPHFYRYGEGERLMAPVYYLARRTTIDGADWEAWFAALVPKAGEQSQAALAYRHNLKSFLYPLYASLAESKDEAQRARLLPLVTKVLKQLD
ncbi:MAG: DUF2785 domain-containing protein [Pseudomonadota bacterium]